MRVSDVPLPSLRRRAETHRYRSLRPYKQNRHRLVEKKQTNAVSKRLASHGNLTEIKVLMVNLGDRLQRIEHGERLVQIVIAPAIRAVFEAVSEIAESDRAGGGFGSTGRS